MALPWLCRPTKLFSLMQTSFAQELNLHRSVSATQMKLIEQDELDAYRAALARLGLRQDDFDLSETDTTDPKTDEIFALEGFVVITRKSTQQQKQYPIGDGSAWVATFERDLAKNAFG